MAAEHADLFRSIAPIHIFHVDMENTIRELVDEVYIIHSLIPQMARIVIKTESRMIIDRFKSLTGRISIERDLGRMHFESETDT